MDSANSAAVITGRLIFLTMTALPDSDAATSFVLKVLRSKMRLIAAATAPPSMIAPSTMLSGGTGSTATAPTLKPLPLARSSTALTALDPMSSPTTDFDLFSPNMCSPIRKNADEANRKGDTRPQPLAFPRKPAGGGNFCPVVWRAVLLFG